MRKKYSKPVDPGSFAYSDGKNLESLAAKFDRFWDRVRPIGTDRVEITCPCGRSEIIPYFGRYYRCAWCGHLMVSAVRSEEAVVNYYCDEDEYNAHYFNPALRAYKMETIYRPKSEYVRAHAIEAGLPDKPSLLDYGCGAGLFLSCCDWTSERCGVELGDYSRENTAAECAVFERMPDRMFDIITAWAVLEHAVGPVALLRRIISHVKPGGLVVIEVPRADSVSTHHFLRQDVMAWRHATADHLHLFSDKSLFAMIDWSGLKRIEAWYYGLDALTLAISAGTGMENAASSQTLMDAAEMCDAIVVVCKKGEK